VRHVGRLLNECSFKLLCADVLSKRIRCRGGFSTSDGRRMVPAVTFGEDRVSMYNVSV